MADIVVDLDYHDGDMPRKMDSSVAAIQRLAGKVADGSSAIQRMEERSRSLVATMRDVSIVISQSERAFTALESVSTSWVRKIVDVTAEFERMVAVMRSLSTASDPLKQAAEQVTELRDIAKEAPFSLQAIHQAMTRLSSVSLGTKENMIALTDAVAAFGGTDEALGRASLALQEMAGKGVVQMKELRNQLMMAVPNAGQLVARAFGESYEQVMSDIHTGTVDATKTINGFMLEAERAFGGAAQRQMQTFNGLIGQTKALLTSLAIDDVAQEMTKDKEGKVTGQVNEAGFFGQMKKQMQDFNQFLQSDAAKGIGQNLGSGLTTAVQDMRAMVDFAVRFHDEIKMAAEGLAVGFAMRLSFAGWATGQSAISGLINSFRTMRSSWTEAMDAIESRSTGAAMQRIAALKTAAASAANALDEAKQRSQNASKIADMAQVAATTSPTAVVRSQADQDKLDKSANAAYKRYQAARLELDAMLEKNQAEAAERIGARMTQAAAAQAKYEEIYTNPKSSEKQVADAFMNASNARRDAEIERLRETRIATDNVASAERDLHAKRNEYERAEAARTSAPAINRVSEAEQLAANETALRARKVAREREDEVERSAAQKMRAEAALSEAEISASGSRMGSSFKNVGSIMGAVGTSLGFIATWAPIAGIAIGVLADYFDLFGTKARDSWEELERYGASTSKDAEEKGRPFIESLEKQIKLLQEKRDMASTRETGGYAPQDEYSLMTSPGSAADYDSEIAQKTKEKTAAEKEYAEVLLKNAQASEAAAYSRKQMGVFDRDNMDRQLRYNQDETEAQKKHADIVQQLSMQRRSSASENLRYQEQMKSTALAYYDGQIKSLNEMITAEQDHAKAAKEGSQDQINAKKTLIDLNEKLRNVTDAKSQEQAQDMGLFKHIKPVDDGKLIQNADSELEKLAASISGYKAGIEGADEAAEKLYQVWLRMGRAGDANTESVRQALELMRELKQTSDDYKAIMEGGHKLDKDINDAIDKAQDKIFQNEHGKESTADQIRAKMAEGKYAGYGGSDPEAQRLTRMREELDRGTQSWGLFGQAAQRALGPELVSNLDRMTGALSGNTNALLALRGGLPQIGATGSGPLQWNNPGNISAGSFASRFGGEAGAGPGGRFATFPSPEAGYQAANANLDSYARQGVTTLRDILMKWAPPSENNTAAYIANMSKATGVGADEALPANKRAEFLHAMTQVEKGKASPYSVEEIRAMIERTPAEMAPRRGVSMADKADRDLARLDAITARERQSNADFEKNALLKKYQTKDVAEAMEAGGAGKNYASMVAWIREHGKATSIGSADENAAGWKTAIDIAKKRDTDEASLKSLRERTTAADSAEKANSEKLKSTSADLANNFARLMHQTGAYSDTVQKEIDAAKQRTAAVVARYGENSPQAGKARADEKSITDNEISKGVFSDVEQAQKKIQAFREAAMGQEQAQADLIQHLRQEYDRDLANFKGTAEQKAAIAKIFNDRIAAEQQELAEKTPLGKQMKEWSDVTKNVQQDIANFSNSAVDGLTNMVLTGKNNWSQTLGSLSKSLLSTSIKGLLGGLMNGSGLSGLLGGGMSKLGGAGAAAAGGGAGKLGSLGAMLGFMHTGGIVGSGDGFRRFVGGGSLFHSAPRYHTGGLAGDEVPIIAQRGEGVFTKGQMSAMGAKMSRAGGGHQIAIHNNVSVNANGGDSAQNADLAKQIGAHVERITRSTVIQELSNQMRPGNLLSSDPNNIFRRA